MGKIYQRHKRQFQHRQFKPCPLCWRGRANSQYINGRLDCYPVPKPRRGWPYAIVDNDANGYYRIKCSKCGHETQSYPSGVGAIREWNGSSSQWA